MTITSKELSQPAGLTGVARDEAEKKLKELKELQSKIDNFKFSKKKSKQKKNK
jgi:hypothetical protein